MRTERRQGYPFPKPVERYTAKRPTPEAGQPTPGLLGQPEQLPHDGGLNAPEPLPPKRMGDPQAGEMTAGGRLLMRQPHAVFDCVVPRVIPSPFHVRRMLRDELVTEKQAQEAVLQWEESIRTMDKLSLEGQARWWTMMRDRFVESGQQEEAKEIQQQLDVVQEQLRQREVG